MGLGAYAPSYLNVAPAGLLWGLGLGACRGLGGGRPPKPFIQKNACLAGRQDRRIKTKRKTNFKQVSLPYINSFYTGFVASAVVKIFLTIWQLLNVKKRRHIFNV